MGRLWMAGAVGLYLVVCRALRYRRRDQFRRLYAQGKQQDIVRMDHEIEFPWIWNQSQEFALFRTYAIPSISRLLARTRKFSTKAGKRYDDTTLLLSEITEQGHDSARGELALRRLNAIHGQFGSQISNADLLYTLSVFVVEPVRWVDRFEWRPCDECERQALATWWTDVGGMMGIKDIPRGWEGFAAFHDEYEESHMRFSPDNVVIADATNALLLSPFPSVLHSTIMRCTHCLMDPRLRAAMGYPDPPWLLQSVVVGVLRLRGLLIRYLSLPRPDLLSTHRTPREGGAHDRLQCRFHRFEKTYKDGYKVAELGDIPPGRVAPVPDRSGVVTGGSLVRS